MHGVSRAITPHIGNKRFCNLCKLWVGGTILLHQWSPLQFAFFCDALGYDRYTGHSRTGVVELKAALQGRDAPWMVRRKQTTLLSVPKLPKYATLATGPWGSCVRSVGPRFTKLWRAVSRSIPDSSVRAVSQAAIRAHQPPYKLEHRWMGHQWVKHVGDMHNLPTLPAPVLPHWTTVAALPEQAPVQRMLQLVVEHGAAQRLHSTVQCCALLSMLNNAL